MTIQEYMASSAKYFYGLGLWSIEQLDYYVYEGILTKEGFKDATGQDFVG